MNNESSQFTVPAKYTEHDKEKLDVELKEISFLLFQVYQFHNNAERHFTTPVFPYSLSFLTTTKHPWTLVSCKVEPPAPNKRKITFSFAASMDGLSFQNCSGYIDQAEITKLTLELWIKENPQFLEVLRKKKESYKNNFLVNSTKS